MRWGMGSSPILFFLYFFKIAKKTFALMKGGWNVKKTAENIGLFTACFGLIILILKVIFSIIL